MLRPAPCQLGYIRKTRPNMIQFGADRPHPTLRGTSSQSALMYTPADRNPYSLLLPGEAGHQGDATSGDFSPAGFLKWRRLARGEKQTGHSPITGRRPPQLDACRYWRWTGNTQSSHSLRATASTQWHDSSTCPHVLTGKRGSQTSANRLVRTTRRQERDHGDQATILTAIQRPRPFYWVPRWPRVQTLRRGLPSLPRVTPCRRSLTIVRIYQERHGACLESNQ